MNKPLKRLCVMCFASIFSVHAKCATCRDWDARYAALTKQEAN